MIVKRALAFKPQQERVFQHLGHKPAETGRIGAVNQVLRQIPPPFVVDGRDMGSTVFPQARYKFFLTASPEVRAMRRVPERGAAFDTVLAEIMRRDEADKKQSAPASDALILDTSQLDLDGVVRVVLEHIAPSSGPPKQNFS